MTQLTEQQRKAKMVKAISAALVEAQAGSISAVNYECWRNEKTGERLELILVHFTGGAFCVRNETANSVAQTYRTIAELIFGGYYSEVPFYNSLRKNKAWTQEVI